jgi:outer membrane receptor protein involved in Fe transport
MSSSLKGIPLRRSPLAMAIATAIAGAHAADALAADALEEVIVTARKRQENLQDIPESIQALRSETLARAGLQELEDYSRFLPSLSYTAQAPGANKLIFRGVADTDRSFYSDTSAAIYLDEQPLTQPTQTPEPRLIDIERVEALSGPQGTLYGGSAQSGTLRIVTNKPDPSKFETIVDATVKEGSTSDLNHDVSAVLNIPLVPNELAIRLVGFSAKDAGFIDNVFGLSPGGTFDNADVVHKNKGGEGEYVGGRAALRWLPDDKWSVTAGVVYQDFEGAGNQDHEPFTAGDLNNVRFLDEKREDEWTQVGLTVEAELGFADLVSATTYFTREVFYHLDNTTYAAYLRNIYATYAADGDYYTSAPQYAFGPDPVGLGWLQTQRTRRYSQELRLSHAGTQWAWLAGLFYEHFDDHWDYRSQMDDFESTNAFLNYWVPYYNAVPGTSENAFYHINNHTITDQFAGFGELTYFLNDQWSFIVGGRWFSQKRDRHFIISQPANTVIDDQHPIERTDGFAKKASVRYRIDDRRMVYLLYSEGFRNGGANIVRQGAVLPREFEPDKLKNYELGFKSRWWADRLQVNVSLFHMAWDDFQTEVSDPGPLFASMVINAGDAEIDGVEVDLSVTPTDGLELGFNIGLLDTQLKNDLILPPDPTDPNSTETVLALKGARLPISPETKWAAYAQYTLQQKVLGGSPYARIQYSYNGDALNDLECSAPDCEAHQVMDAYEIVDAKIGIEGEEGDWEVSVFVDNLTDERAQLYKFDIPVGAVTVNRPREYGVRFMKKWSGGD